MEARLKSSIQVKALIRRCDLATIGVAVTARGDPDAGAILVKLCGRDTGAAVLAQARRADGTLGWLRATGAALVALCFGLSASRGSALALALGAGFAGAASVASFLRLLPPKPG